ncbi:MAG: carbohydrate binding family 9 domain-containing protein [Calditrichaeota bacterium]|nr:carbohydrate binding family 9 domain-containing protein [Calditrichota bacterium]
MKFRTAVLVLVLIISQSVLIAETHSKRVVQAVRISEPIQLDGILNEPQWKQAVPATDFIQREPQNGRPATERTEVRILYDANNLYLGVLCYDSAPDKIIANTLIRDSSMRGDDRFTVVFDTYLDHQRGFVFVTNPKGARFDAYQAAPEHDPDGSWNTVWDVRTRITAKGWQAEIVIPFKSLRFPNRPNQVWGINFQRYIQRKHEEDIWSGWGYNEGITYLTFAGELHGLINLKRGHQIEWFPYLKAGIQKEETDGVTQTILRKTGFNIKYGITPTLTADFTVNTDFAQVEADRARINLTRFSLYYPEKRDFFLEGANIFKFGGYRSQIFYSRRIGLSENGEEIPILAGTRLTGRVGKYSVGLLNIQTAREAGTPSTNFSVIRMQRDFLSQSKFGFIATQKYIPKTGYMNRAFGGDVNFYFTNFLGDKNLAIYSYLAGTQTPGLHGNNLAYRVMMDYPNDLIDSYAYFYTIDPNFNPEIGFVRRKGIRRGGGAFRYTPRPHRWGIRKFVFKPVDVDYTTDMSGQMTDFEYELRPLGFSTVARDYFEFNLQRSFVRLTEPFSIYGDIEIPAGSYWYNHAEIQYETNPGRFLSGALFLNWGNFYTGKRTVFATESLAKFNAHFSVSLDFTWNNIRLREGSFQTQEWGSRIRYAFSTLLDTRAFVQWNNEDQELNLNFRLHWIPNLGSHFYLVYNHLLSTENRTFKTENRTLILKLNYLFRW